jgi:hypothetical protein
MQENRRTVCPFPGLLIYTIDYKENTVMSERKIINSESVMMSKKGDAMACFKSPLCHVKGLRKKNPPSVILAQVYTHSQTLGTNHCCECA